MRKGKMEFAEVAFLSKINTNSVIIYKIFWEQKIPKQRHNFPKGYYCREDFTGYIISFDVALDQMQ